MATTTKKRIVYLRYRWLLWSRRCLLLPISLRSAGGKLRSIAGAAGARVRLSAWVIVGGLCAEIVILLTYAAEKTWLETVLLVGCTLVVAIGVFGEDHFAHVSGEVASELQRRADVQIAHANERAAVALKGAVLHQKELDALKNPRKFDLNKFNETMALEPRPGAKAEILYVRDCPDCIFLASMIWAGVKKAEWEIVRYGPLPEPKGDKSHLPAAFSVNAMPHGITVVSKVATFLPAIPQFPPPPKDSPSGVLHFAICQAMGVVFTGITGQIDELMPDDTVRVVIAPRT